MRESSEVWLLGTSCDHSILGCDHKIADIGQKRAKAVEFIFL
jgi:hypothetical protein